MIRPGPTLLKRGEVVLADYPYSDRSGAKVRPCVVIQSVSSRGAEDTILLPVTSRIRDAEQSATLVVVRSRTAEGRAAGLLTDSVIVCDSVTTIDQSFVRRPIGLVSGDLLDRVETALRTTLGLS